jgi:hypothetical protein
LTKTKQHDTVQMMNDDQIVRLIRGKQGEQSLRAYASQIGVSAAYLSDVLNGHRGPGKKMLKFFGIEKTRRVTVTYAATRKKK